MQISRMFLASAVLLSIASRGHGFATEEIGPAKDRQVPTTAQPGWPTGMKEIVDHDARVYSRWVNGSVNTYYQAAPHEIIELIKLYSEVRLREHVLTIEAGPQSEKTFGGDKVPYNVAYRHLGGLFRSMNRGGDEAATHEPTLVIHVDPRADRTWWDAAQVPEHLIVNSQAVDWPIKTSATKPHRRAWHARILFDDQEPAADFENGLSTRVTLWKADDHAGFDLGKVNHKGEFSAAFSDEEIAKLKSDKMWLTLTVGNYLVAARPDHPKLELTHLSLNIEEVQAFELAKAKFYYGRRPC